MELDDPEFAQWVPSLITRLIPILLHPKAPRSLHENAAVSIGRIGLMHPSIVAPHLNEFAQAWCQALHDIRDNEEKDSAFRGLCQLVQVNPGGIWKASVINFRGIALPYSSPQSLLWFCNAIVRWQSPSPGLNHAFQEILRGLKEWDPVAWNSQVPTFPQGIQARLHERYGV